MSKQSKRSICVNSYGEVQWFQPGDLVRDLITHELARVVKVIIGCEDEDDDIYYELDISDDDCSNTRTVFEVICPQQISIKTIAS
jgi:hypothetical protein